MNIDLEEAEQILEKLQHWSSTLSRECMEFRSHLDHQAQRPNSPFLLNKSEPMVRLDGNNLWVDHLLIPLSTRERTLKLVEAFFQNGDLTLKKKAIISHVYNTPMDASERLILALEIRLIKLMSRTRHFLNSATASSSWKKKMEWFVFDQKSQTYRLYVIRQNASHGEFALMPPLPNKPKAGAAILFEA